MPYRTSLYISCNATRVLQKSVIFIFPLNSYNWLKRLLDLNLLFCFLFRLKVAIAPKLPNIIIVAVEDGSGTGVMLSLLLTATWSNPIKSLGRPSIPIELITSPS